MDRSLVLATVYAHNFVVNEFLKRLPLVVRDSPEYRSEFREAMESSDRALELLRELDENDSSQTDG